MPRTTLRVWCSPRYCQSAWAESRPHRSLAWSGESDSIGSHMWRVDQPQRPSQSHSDGSGARKRQQVVCHTASWSRWTRYTQTTWNKDGYLEWIRRRSVVRANHVGEEGEGIRDVLNHIILTTSHESVGSLRQRRQDSEEGPEKRPDVCISVVRLFAVYTPLEVWWVQGHSLLWNGPCHPAQNPTSRILHEFDSDL